MSRVRVRAPRRGGLARGGAGVLVAVILAAGLSGCAWLERTNAKTKLTGQRYSVLTLDNQVETDPSLAGMPVTLPSPTDNADWPQPGGDPRGDVGHVGLGDRLAVAWTADVGEGKSNTARVLVPPIVAAGRVFTLDARGTVTAVDAKTGGKAWSRPLAPKKEDPDAGYAGGIAYDGGRLFVASGFGFVVALDPASGKEIWRHEVGVPLRAAPVATDGRVFVITEDNQIYTLAQGDGQEEWNYQGIVEPARLLGNPSVAVDQDTVVVPFSSGELFALRAQNGGVLWSDSLTRTGPQTSLSTLSDIAGRPAIDRSIVYAISHSGRMAAIDMRSGERRWAINLASTESPWVAGDFVYVITVDAEIVCLAADSGKVKWVGQLPRWRKPKDKKDPIEWSGPVLAGNRLIALSSDGQVISIAPGNGALSEPIRLKTGTFAPPVVAGRTLYVLTSDAKLVALR